MRSFENECIRDEDWEELQDYANKNGRKWKAKLSEEWASGGEAMRKIRNTLGPSGLYKIRLDARKHSPK